MSRGRWSCNALQCQHDIQEALPILDRACLLRMLAHGHGCLAKYSAGGPSKAKSRSELAASFRIVSTWRLAIVQNLRLESSRNWDGLCRAVLVFFVLFL